MALSPTLRAALTTIAAERPNFAEETADAVIRVIQEYGPENLIDRLYGEVPADWPLADLTSLIGFVQRQLSYAHADAASTTDRWLREAEDERKVAIGLKTSWRLFLGSEEADEILLRIAGRFTPFKCECDRLLARNRLRRQQHEQFLQVAGH